ncbi:unnamed protein product [Sphagnum compactum]
MRHSKKTSYLMLIFNTSFKCDPTTLSVFFNQTTTPYVPVDNILISCGSSTNVPVDGRVFVADSNARTLASGGVSASISQPSPNLQHPSLMQQARFFTTNSSYTFTVTPGRHWIRLYFYPFAFANWAANASLFSVTANQFVLLNEFRPSSLTSPDSPSLFREYAVNVSAGSLVLGFDPALNSYAFINALEVVSMPDDLFSDDAALERNAILNGVEILKLNNSGVSSSLTRASNSAAVIGAAVGSVIAFVLMVVCVCYCCSHKSKAFAKHATPAWLSMSQGGSDITTTQSKVSSSHKSGTGSYMSTVGTNPGRYFTFAELQEATNNFDESWILGVGGFGKVYKGEIDDGTKVAVKRGNPRSEQGLTEFQTEIEMLSKLRHRHLVSLIGYCDEHCEMILIYDYMANGPLRGHLYGTDLPSLSWKQRLEICIGAARGLHYLHTGAARGIIHRDVKTTNILLDENFVAKVADFGLSKTGPTLEQSHVSTAVKGSFGYLDPEYFRRQQLTEKSDVYSFGVVLMEVLCARPPISPNLPREQVNIAEWAMQKQKQGLLETIMDPQLLGLCNPESLQKFGDTAEKCLQEQGIDRPSMGDVLWNLEYALHLQENSGQPNLMDVSSEVSSLVPHAVPGRPVDDASNVTGVSEAHSSGSDNDLEDISASAVFSQLVNPQGR